MTVERALARWGALQGWILPQRFFRENLGLGGGGETGPDDDVARQVFERTGVSVMGKRMFDGGEMFWPEEAPFHTPVFVVTHQQRDPWERPGGTTFHFVNDGIESARAQAAAVAAGRDVRISGGADLIQQYLAAGLVDECLISLAPVVLGGGTALFDRIGWGRIGLEPIETIATPRANHLRFAVTAG